MQNFIVQKVTSRHRNIIYSGAVRRKRVSKQVTPVDAQTITGLNDIKYGPRGGSPEVAPAGGFIPWDIGRFGWQSTDYSC